MTMFNNALRSDMSDDELNAVLERYGHGDQRRWAVESLQTAATQSYKATRKLDMPRNVIDATWKSFQERAAQARSMSSVHGWVPGPADVRVALEAKEYFDAVLKEWPTLSLDEKRKRYTEDGLHSGSWTPPQAAVASPPPFNPNDYVATMTQRGIRLGVITQKGADFLTALPAERLNDADRETLKLHKGAIIAALENAAIVA